MKCYEILDIGHWTLVVVLCNNVIIFPAAVCPVGGVAASGRAGRVGRVLYILVFSDCSSL